MQDIAAHGGTAPNGAAASKPTELDRLFEAQRAAFARDPMPGAVRRIEHLKRLKRILIHYQERIIAAIDGDFGGRSRDETLLAEMLPSVEGIRFAEKRVKKWMRPARRRVGLLFQPAKARVIYQPMGVVGVIVPWNYPLYLGIGPMVGALAAGNRIMIKMSRNTPETGRVLQTMIQEAFAEDHVALMTGEQGPGAAFAQKPWDHLIFTGSTHVGRQVMRSAAANLTPVTLELGGKSPAIIGPRAPMAHAAERIAFGKLLNAGQTCVAPDYVLCPRRRIDAFVAAFRESVAAMYPVMDDSPQYTSIINAKEYERLGALCADAEAKGARLVAVNPAREPFDGGRKRPVCLALNVTDEMQMMQEEIFGPVLPVIPYDDLQDAVAYVNQRPRPLALYFFDENRAHIDYVLSRTHSGGVLVNDTLMHVAQDDLPFGGIGASGMGQYHGREGFLAFSKAKGVMIRPRFNSARFVNPPYGKWIHKLIYRLFLG